MPWLSKWHHHLPAEDLLTWTFDHCTYDKEKPIYIDAHNPHRTLSHTECLTTVRRLIAGFRAAGLQPGDCVSIAAFNDILYPLLFLGLIGAGGIFSGSNPAYTPYELHHHVRTAEVKFILAEPELLPTILEGSEGLVDRGNIFVFNPLPHQSCPEGFRSWEWLLQHGAADWRRFSGEATCKQTTLARLTTSGTTGPPKMAVQSHYNATSYYTSTREIRPPDWEVRNLFPLPMFHVSTVPAVHAGPLRSGDVSYIMRRFELEAFLAGVERWGISYLALVPPLVIAIINSPLRHEYSLRSLMRVQAGAAPLDAESARRFRELCAPDATFTQALGMTETTSVVCSFYYPDADDTGSVGNTFIPNTDVKLIDDEGTDITAPDIRGELSIRGPTVIPFYHANPTANAASWDSEGYYRTGDIMYCASDTGKWYIVDRKKELIKVRGFQIAPPELEAVLLAHRDVVDVAVIGLKPPPGKDAELVRAYVVRRDGAGIDEEGMKGLVRGKLARYKWLTGGVKFVDEIPKSASGKILKRDLREEAEREELSRSKARL